MTIEFKRSIITICDTINVHLKAGDRYRVNSSLSNDRIISYKAF